MHRSTLILILIALLLPTTAQAGQVLRVTIDMAIGPVTEKVIGEALERAFESRYDLVVIEIDTPGGLEQSMRLICRQLLNADVAGVDDLPADVPLDGVVVYLADGGKLATTGTRPVGSLCGHPDKGPIAHLEPAACAALGPSGAVAACGACSVTSEPAAGPVDPSEAKETSTRRVRRKSKTPKE